MVSIYHPYSLLNITRGLPIVFAVVFLSVGNEIGWGLPSLLTGIALLTNLGKSGTRFDAVKNTVEGTYRIFGVEFGIIKTKLPPIEYVSVLLSKTRLSGYDRFGQKVIYSNAEDKFTIQLIFSKHKRRKVSERLIYSLAWEDAFLIARHFNVPIYNASERELPNIMIYPEDFSFYEKQLSTL